MMNDISYERLSELVGMDERITMLMSGACRPRWRKRIWWGLFVPKDTKALLYTGLFYKVDFPI